MNNYQSSRTRSKKSPFRFLILLFILIIAGGAFAKFYWDGQFSPVDPTGTSKAFVIQKGESVGSIIERLKGEGLVKSDLALKFALRQSGKSDQIIPGDYKLSPAMSTNEIVNNLLSGPIDRWVTLLEGWRNEEIANKLNKELGIKNEDFLKYAQEGYMFPDTYLFNVDATGETIASTMKNTFKQRFTQDLQQKISAKGITPDQGVILASIVEREARSDEVRTNVASILLKRYRMGMALNADATVQYAKDTAALKNGTLKSFWTPVTQADYQAVVSPYNTYLHAGFPPTPIANPSLSSLKAVANANPATPYIYYYHDSQGNTYYSKTLEEHNENVARYP